MRVQNMTSQYDNKIANQFIITDDEGNEYFQSYESIIAKKDYTGEKKSRLSGFVLLGL